jgi:hypothetical protein
MCVIIVCTMGYDDIVRSAEEFLEDPGGPLSFASYAQY